MQHTSGIGTRRHWRRAASYVNARRNSVFCRAVCRAHALPFFGATMLFGLGALMVVPGFDYRPPVHYESIKPVDAALPERAPGDLLNLSVTATWDALRSCDGGSTHVFTDAGGNRKIDGWSHISSPFIAADRGRPITYEIERVVPVMRPGLATYQGQIRIYCHWLQRLLGPIPVATPLVAFTIRLRP
jgi:hypothetical protein